MKKKKEKRIEKKSRFLEALIILFIAFILINLSISVYLIYQTKILFSEVGKLKNKGNIVILGDKIPTEISSIGFSESEKSIPIVAVSSDGIGVIGNLTVKLIPGNNNVLINTNPFLETDIQYSVNKAVVVAKLHSKDYNYDKDFIFDFKAGNAQLIGGESAGAAITLATLAALQNKKLKKEAVITGTINPDGTIGKVGAILEKAKAVAEAGYKYFLVPKGQSKVVYYEKVVTKEPIFKGFEILNTRYVPKTIDLKELAEKEWGLQVVEVSKIEEALPYFIEE